MNETVNIPASTAGLTTKVVKGSLWTLCAQVFPLFATLISTPITIRLLGSENYGLLILVGLIPTYFTFADLGMGVASTRFCSTEFAAGNRRGEADVVWTAATLALLCSLIFAVPTFLFSERIMDALRVPIELHREGSTALRITTVAFVLGLLGNVFNAPQLSRLRMDINGLIIGGSRVGLSILTPIVIFLGGGLVGATLVGLLVTIAALLTHFYFSARLLSAILRPSLRTAIALPLIKFGLGFFIAGIAVALLTNFEKLLLPRLVSIEALAYYSVAFTFANMTTMFGIATVQSLVPALSQLLGRDKKLEFDELFSRAVRLNLIWIPPAMMFLFIIARPFFTLFAGEEFGIESTVPFYILLLGLLFNLVAYIPYSAITAYGRSDVFAKLYWIELIGFCGIIFVLVNSFGILGAAASWSARVIFDSFILIWLSKRIAGVPFRFSLHFLYLLIGIIVMSPPLLYAALYDNFSFWLIPIALVSAGAYTIGTWKYLIGSDEKAWMIGKARSLMVNRRST